MVLSDILILYYLIQTDLSFIIGPIYLDRVRCVGNEESITECNFVGFGNLNCLHTQDAGVHCNSKFNRFFYEMFSLQV